MIISGPLGCSPYAVGEVFHLVGCATLWKSMDEGGRLPSTDLWEMVPLASSHNEADQGSCSGWPVASMGDFRKRFSMQLRIQARHSHDVVDDHPHRSNEGFEKTCSGSCSHPLSKTSAVLQVHIPSEACVQHLSGNIPVLCGCNENIQGKTASIRATGMSDPSARRG